VTAEIRQVAVIGGGLVGLGWAIVFARAGLSVSLYDADEVVRRAAPARFKSSLSDMASFDLVENIDEIAGRLRICDRLEEAVRTADYIQESVFESVEVKHAVSVEIGGVMRPDAVCGSSSSGIPASHFTADVPHRSRFLVVHPVNPPHLVPLVELVAAPWTDPDIVPMLRTAMERLGQVPIVVNREVDGFVLNRLQGALLNEAWALFDEGVASAADIDRTVSAGLGYRWSFMGPFETIDLNAVGGVADYAQRLGPLYHRVAQSREGARAWSPELIARVEAERREILAAADLQRRAAWRDRQIMALVAHRRKNSNA
jgi:L-gulonate 3-dehydrogenase